MQKQKKMEGDIKQTAELGQLCTDEWCRSTENIIDELHKAVYSISEPRWASPAESHRIATLRDRVKDMYVHFKIAKIAAS